MFDYDKNSKKIIVPEGITYIPDEFFKDNKNVEEIVLPSTIKQIGMGAFCGCSSLKKINLPDGLNLLEAHAFSNCTALEEITIPKSLHYFSYGLFSYCRNLKTINCHDDINYIDDFALYNCRSLSSFTLPKNISSLGVKALFGCNKIKSIYIPKSLTTIENAALAMMSSLEKIVVDPENSKFADDDNVGLYDQENGFFIQYAINSKDKEYCLGYYPVSYGKYIDDVTFEEKELSSYEPIYNIGDFAFAGSKYLEKLYMLSVVESFGPKTFLNCPRLKKLDIEHAPYGEVFIFNVHGGFFKRVSVPFEEINIMDGITNITDNTSDLFAKAKKVNLPESIEQLGSNVFYKSKNLKNIYLPKKMKMIAPNTFYPTILLHFDEFGDIEAKDFNMLETKTSDDFYVQYSGKDNIRIFSLVDGTYYVGIDDYDVVKVTRDEINSLSDTSYVLEETPDRLIHYLYDLLSINADSNSMFINSLQNKSLRRKFVSFVNDMDYVTDLAVKKNQRAISDILEEHDLDDEVLFNGILMRKLSKEELTNIVENMSLSLSRFFRFSKYFDPKYFNGEYSYSDYILSQLTKGTSLFTYCNLLEKYQQYDRFLYEPKFVLSFDEDSQEMFIRNYNSNIKRLFLESGILEEKELNNNNLKDLFKFATVLGAFSDNKVLSQRACNFITEKIFSDKMSNGLENKYRIIGDDIHRFFNELVPRDEIDPEFILFFIENYKELIDIEKTTSGFISRVYNSFPEISKASTSDRGSQRHLKVTVNKCKDFFLMNQFEHVGDEDRELADFLGKYYSDIEVLKVASTILKLAGKSPRNIFTNNNNPSEDIKGFSEGGFYYEWLPKQSLENLILGKYCNCCSHINGAGAGIMYASMILSNCQNLVIRNELGNIIAKATLSIDKEKGYGVFNTIEANMNHRSDEQLDKIYDAFMMGCNRFLDEYNKNNSDCPIDTLTIGSHRNVIEDILEKNGHFETTPLISTDYSRYGYAIGNKMVGGYGGDHTEGQKLLFKRPIKK